MSIVIDPRKTEKFLSAPGGKPSLVDVPAFTFLMIDGTGDPTDSQTFADATQALFSVAYPVRFALKYGAGIDHPVMPLEGLWWIEDDVPFTEASRDLWRWTLMIRQAEEVTPEILIDGITKARAKHPDAAVHLLRLERFEEGRAAQIMHTGPYSKEGPTIEKLHAFVADQGLTLHGRHHEIYLGDPRRTAPERLRTILRHPVR
jgi:hypothetical protein